MNTQQPLMKKDQDYVDTIVQACDFLIEERLRFGINERLANAVNKIGESLVQYRNRPSRTSPPPPQFDPLADAITLALTESGCTMEDRSARLATAIRRAIAGPITEPCEVKNQSWGREPGEVKCDFWGCTLPALCGSKFCSHHQPSGQCSNS